MYPTTPSRLRILRFSYAHFLLVWKDELSLHGVKRSNQGVSKLSDRAIADWSGLELVKELLGLVWASPFLS